MLAGRIGATEGAENVRVAMLLTDDGCVDYVGGALLAFGTTGASTSY